MRTTKKSMTGIAAVLSALALVSGCGSAASAEGEAGPIDSSLSGEEVAALTEEAFYWGLNIAGYYELRHVYTQMEGQPAYRGVNRMQPQMNLFDAKIRFATTVNASTLYNGGTFDTSKEPIVVEIPAVTDGRYWSVQAMDQNVTTFFKAGSQFSGNAPQRYVIVGPEWRGDLPAGFKGTEIVKASSDSFTIAVRVGVTTRDDADLAAARATVSGVQAAPLSLWTANGGRVPPLAEQPVVKGDYRSFPRMDQISDIGKSMTAIDYLQLLSLSINDPSLTLRSDSVKETETLDRLSRLGLEEGTIFDPAQVTDEQKASIDEGFARARKAAKSAFENTQIDMNGWRLQSSLFFDDLDYVAKAGADDVAWGTPVPYDSHTIAYVFDDSEGRPLDGRNRYTLTFDVNDLPPTTEFWELPVYDSAGYFIDNPIDRYSTTSELLKAGQYSVVDGKLTFYLQPDRPADPEQARNWLPTSRDGGFQLAARFYGPTTGLIDGSYAMPGIVRVQ
ncbi:DUF1254 domain-containing protein [Prescottella agglutinans]|uniref:DUF1254 domain-containing protein n=1 Tax=Prescottella agglutinans TaxID=1644129 RepID=A0A438B8G0_9NOCA|nr:DUF1254 domain-containing protein [Prescottella agglutinans]RVW07202.1 DUF1254 domain-containing protein [Prescottella agglutinans]